MYSNRIIRKGLNFSLLSGLFAAFFQTATSGAILSGIFILLNLNSFQIGIMTSMTTIFIPMQIIGSILQRRFFNRKKFWFNTTIISMASWIIILIIIIWHHNLQPLTIVFFIAFFSLAQAALQTGISSWFSWMGDLVPQERTAEFWSNKNRIGQLALFIATILFGLIINNTGNESATPYIIVLSFAILMGILSMIIQYLSPDPDYFSTSGQTLSLKNEFKNILKNNNFRVMIFSFGLQSLTVWAWIPFIYIYMQKTIHLSMLQIQIFNGSILVIAFFSGFIVKILSERYGSKPVFIIATTLKIFEFLLWTIFLPGKNIFVLLPIAIFAGLSTIALMTSQISLISRLNIKTDKSITSALFFSILGILGFIGSFLSGTFYDKINSLNFFQTSPFSAIHLLSFLVVVTHIITIFLFFRFKENNSMGPGFIIRRLFSSNPLRSLYQAHILSKPLNEEKRLTTLKGTKGLFNNNEIIAALYNPSTRIREQALFTIARNEKLCDSQIVKELLKLLSMPELGLQIETAKTLGYLHVQKALPYLENCLYCGDISLSQAAVFAIGRIGDHERKPNKNLILNIKKTLKNVTNLIYTERYRTIHPIIAEAIGKCGSYENIRDVYYIFSHQTNIILKKQTLIALVNLLSIKNEFYKILEKETINSGSIFEKEIKYIKKKIEHTKTLDNQKLKEFTNELLYYFDKQEYLKAVNILFFETITIFYPELKCSSEDFIQKKILKLFNNKGEIKFKPFKENSYKSCAWWLLSNLYVELSSDNNYFSKDILSATTHILCEMFSQIDNPVL